MKELDRMKSKYFLIFKESQKLYLEGKKKQKKRNRKKETEKKKQKKRSMSYSI